MAGVRVKGAVSRKASSGRSKEDPPSSDHDQRDVPVAGSANLAAGRGARSPAASRDAKGLSGVNIIRVRRSERLAAKRANLQAALAASAAQNPAKTQGASGGKRAALPPQESFDAQRSPPAGGRRQRVHGSGGQQDGGTR